MAKRILGLVTAIVTIVAAFTVSSACILFLYQPKVPKSLMK